MKPYSTTTTYKKIENDGIQYTVCRDFDHISRYRGLRQVIHESKKPERYMALESPNSFQSNIDVTYHDVSTSEENRLDIIAKHYLGSASYAWVIAYCNEIEDGFTISPGQRLVIPMNLTSLFNKGEILAPVSALALNLGSE